jgi:polar amino acid transport system substrate-binding protein
MSKNSPELVRFVNGVLKGFIDDGSWEREQKIWLAGQIKEVATPPIPVYGLE